MKLSKGFYIILLFTFLLVRCEGSRNTENRSKGNTEIIVEADTQATDVVSGYILLKDAFVASDYEKVKSSAGIFGNLVAGNIDPAFEKAIVSLTNKIMNQGDIEGQRQLFEQISILMYALAENGAFEGTRLYRQFCPMAFNNKGAYWLSLDETILNPYFGDKMLKCGYIEEIL